MTEVAAELWTPARGQVQPGAELWSPGNDGPYVTEHPLATAYNEYVDASAAHLPTGTDYRDTDFARYLPAPGELVTDLDKLPHLMGMLALLAYQAGLPHMRYGLEGYQSVTISCIERIDEFDDQEKIERTMPVFFDEWVRDARRHVEGRVAAVDIWRKLFYSTAARDALPGEAMLDFLDCHVRGDLNSALVRTATLPAHKPDYTRAVNKILTDVAIEILPDYVDMAPVMKKLGFEKLALWASLTELFGARDEAWMMHQDLMGAADLPEYAQLRSMQRQRMESRLISSNKTADFLLRRLVRTPSERWERPDLVVA